MPCTWLPRSTPQFQEKIVVVSHAPGKYIGAGTRLFLSTYAPVGAILVAIACAITFASCQTNSSSLVDSMARSRVSSCSALAVKCKEALRTRFSVKRTAGGVSLDLAPNRSLSKHRELVEWALPWQAFQTVELLRTGRFASHANLAAQICTDKGHDFPPLHEAATVRGCQTTGRCSKLSIYGPVATQFLAEWAIANSPVCCTCRSMLSASETRVPLS